jgi:hypothetical protein
MSCSQPQSSFAKMASRSKVVHGKNNFPSGFLLGHRHVPVPQVQSSPLPLDSSSDDGDDDDNYHDNDTNTHALH